jgi:hypothetical protein
MITLGPVGRGSGARVVGEMVVGALVVVEGTGSTPTSTRRRNTHPM